MYFPNPRSKPNAPHLFLRDPDAALQRVLNDSDERSVTGKKRGLLNFEVEFLGE